MELVSGALPLEILRIIGEKDYNTPITELYQHLNLLHHDDLPPVLHSSFIKLKPIHSHNTMQLEKNAYFLPRIDKSFAQNLLAFGGTKLWSTINPSIKSLHWVSFKIILNLLY